MKEFSRRNFLKLALGAVAVVATDRISHVLVGETVNATEPITGSEIHSFITDEAFLTLEREPKKLTTKQYSSEEYNILSFENNACGQALIATLLKMYGFFKSGIVPEISIQTVRDYLGQNSYFGASEQRDFLEWDMQMRLSSVKAAIELYGSDYSIQTVTFSNIPIPGYSGDQVFSTSVLTEEQTTTLVTDSQDIFSRGGMLVIFSTTYGGHLFLVSNLYRDENNDIRAFVIDSLGPSHDGLVQDMSFSSFIGEWNGQLGLISAFGIYPTYT